MTSPGRRPHQGGFPSDWSSIQSYTETDHMPVVGDSRIIGNLTVNETGVISLDLNNMEHNGHYPLSGLVTASGDVLVNGMIRHHCEPSNDEWVSPFLLNGWTNYGQGFDDVAYFKDSCGVVHLRGMVCGGNGAIFSLPGICMPDRREIFAAPTYPNAIGRVDVLADGKVSMVTGDNAWVSLNGLAFRAALSPSGRPWIAPTLQNGWSDYSNAYNPCGYYKDNKGFVHLRGLVKEGHDVIFTLPSDHYRPAHHESVAVNCYNRTIGRCDVLSSGEVIMQSGKNGWFSLDGITFRAKEEGFPDV